MPVGALPVDRWVAQVWAGYWHASKHDVIQGRLARWYQYDIAFQHWVLAALPRAWNCWVRTYLRRCRVTIAALVATLPWLFVPRLLCPLVLRSSL